MTTSMVGNGFTLNPGDVTDMPDATAIRMIEAGFAVALEAAITGSGRAKRSKQALETTRARDDLETPE